MRVAILNPNTSRSATRMMCAVAARHAPPGVRLEGLTPPKGPALISTEEEFRTACEVVVAMAPRLAEFDGVIVAAFGDPGAAELRQRLAVPVVGIAQTAMDEAAAFGRFSIVTATPGLTEMLHALAERYGHAGALVSMRLTRGNPLALMREPERLLQELRSAAEAAVRDGAEAIVVGGGPLAAAAEALARQVTVPVVAPVPAALRRVTAMSAAACVH